MPVRAKPLIKDDQRRALCLMFLDVARMVKREYMPGERFGSHMEALYVAICVAIGHMERRPFTVAKLAAYLEAPRTNVIRRLDHLIKWGLVERRGQHYFLVEHRFNTTSALRTHESAARLVKATAVKLSV